MTLRIPITVVNGRATMVEQDTPAELEQGAKVLLWNQGAAPDLTPFTPLFADLPERVAEQARAILAEHDDRADWSSVAHLVDEHTLDVAVVA